MRKIEKAKPEAAAVEEKPPAGGAGIGAGCPGGVVLALRPATVVEARGPATRPARTRTLPVGAAKAVIVHPRGPGGEVHTVHKDEVKLELPGVGAEAPAARAALLGGETESEEAIGLLELPAVGGAAIDPEPREARPMPPPAEWRPSDEEGGVEPAGEAGRACARGRPRVRVVEAAVWVSAWLV